MSDALSLACPVPFPVPGPPSRFRGPGCYGMAARASFTPSAIPALIALLIWSCTSDESSAILGSGCSFSIITII